jgi:hypothetical protein
MTLDQPIYVRQRQLEDGLDAHIPARVFVPALSWKHSLLNVIRLAVSGTAVR